MKKFIIYSISLLVLISFTGCNKKVAAAEEEKVETVFAVNAYKAVPQTLDNYLDFGGNVQAASSVDIYPDTNGKISKIYAKKNAIQHFLCYTLQK